MNYNFNDIILDYPYEDALCLFYVKETSPEWYKLATKSPSSHYQYISSSNRPEFLETAKNYAILFDNVRVHPIDLPIYLDNKPTEIIRVSDQGDRSSLSDLIKNSKVRDNADETLKSLFKSFGNNSSVVEQRFYWHLLDSIKFQAPIAVSGSLLPLYNHKLISSISGKPSDMASSRKILQMDLAVEDELGVSFKINNWSDLLAIRNDPDIKRYREKLSYFLAHIGEPDLHEKLKAEVREALLAVREIEKFKKTERLQTYMSPGLSVLDVFAGGLPLFSGLSDLVSISRALKIKNLEDKHRWLFFKMRTLGEKRLI